MTAPLSDELATATRSLISATSGVLTGFNSGTRDRAIRALARYEMAQEDNVTVVVPQPETDEAPPEVETVEIPQAELVSLLRTLYGHLALLRSRGEFGVADDLQKKAHVVADHVLVPVR